MKDYSQWYILFWMTRSKLHISFHPFLLFAYFLFSSLFSIFQRWTIMEKTRILFFFHLNTDEKLGAIFYFERS